MEIEADIHVGDVQLTRQRELIASLELLGRASPFACEILKELEAIQAKQIILRDRLRADLDRSRPAVGHGHPAPDHPAASDTRGQLSSDAQALGPVGDKLFSLDSPDRICSI
ncbi:hypothetical protein GCM10010994_16660 [Chelatococcus reniformis]|uniref:Uncharacterized protein n=1 Tax=Chelatococcus reniformis TaxID=1494448 RepID=A0A916U5J1_9HYPH|nr:hypothetical protein GCM10010994_16660 [Chelatococcus reniformis]